MSDTWWSDQLSIHRQGGWSEQYARVLRWRDRVLRRQTNFSDSAYLDDLYSFFIICLSLRDWLLRDGVGSAGDLRALFDESKPLQVCRDIANGIKHLNLDESRRSTLAFAVGRQHQGPPFVVFRTGDDAEQLIELPDLVSACVADWNAWLSRRVLLGSIGHSGAEGPDGDLGKH